MGNKNRFIGGLVLLGLSAVIMVFGQSNVMIPAGITLTIVGLVLVATSKRGA